MSAANKEGLNHLHHKIFLEDTPPWGKEVSLEAGIGELITACDNVNIIKFLETSPRKHLEEKTIQTVYVRKTHPEGGRTHSLGIAGKWNRDRTIRLLYMRNYHKDYQLPILLTTPPELWIGIFTEFTWKEAVHKARKVFNCFFPLPIVGMNPKDLSTYLRLRYEKEVDIRRPGDQGRRFDEIEFLAENIQSELVHFLKPLT